MRALRNPWGCFYNFSVNLEYFKILFVVTIFNRTENSVGTKWSDNLGVHGGASRSGTRALVLGPPRGTPHGSVVNLPPGGLGLGRLMGRIDLQDGADVPPRPPAAVLAVGVQRAWGGWGEILVRAHLSGGRQVSRVQQNSRAGARDVGTRTQVCGPVALCAVTHVHENPRGRTGKNTSPTRS